MSRSQASQASDSLPPSARSIALLLASTPTVQDAQPGVLHQLLEFAHRYTAQILSDAQVYAEHAGRAGAAKIEMDDVVLAIQARVGWEFGGRVPKEYLLSLATQTNATPLPAVPEVFGVRLPPPNETLTAVNFDLIPNKPPPGIKLYDEEIEEIEDDDEPETPAVHARVISGEEEEEEEEDDADMEPTSIPFRTAGPITPADIEMTATPISGPIVAAAAPEEGSDGEEEDGLFGAGGDDEEEEEEEESNPDDAMEEIQTNAAGANGITRKLVEEEDYD